MQVTTNETLGTTTIVVDGHELGLLRKAVWDEQVLYYTLLRDRKWRSIKQQIEQDERLRDLNNMAQALGGNVC